MKIEDVVAGKRVKVVSDSDNVIPTGATGTLIETQTAAPYVGFDENYEGCFKFNGYQNVRALSHYEIEEI